MEGEEGRGREGRGAERSAAELWHHPQPFLQRPGVGTEQRRQTKGGARNKGGRREDVEQLVTKGSSGGRPKAE